VERRRGREKLRDELIDALPDPGRVDADVRDAVAPGQCLDLRGLRVEIQAVPLEPLERAEFPPGYFGGSATTQPALSPECEGSLPIHTSSSPNGGRYCGLKSSHTAQVSTMHGCNVASGKPDSESSMSWHSSKFAYSSAPYSAKKGELLRIRYTRSACISTICGRRR
jgi:hypothetical protein